MNEAFRMKYIICSPPLDMLSAGLIALQMLNPDIQTSGFESRIIPPWANIKAMDDEIVIYPDTIRGNPFEAKNVVRYLLMEAGFFGDDKDFPESEMIFYYSSDFILNNRNPENILSIPTVKESRFPHKAEGRIGSCYLAKKYASIKKCSLPELPRDCIPITHLTNLEDLFSKVKTLITFDNSAINIEALLCGIEIDWRFNEYFKKPFTFGEFFSYEPNKIHDSYKELKRRYIEDQLPHFIGATQARFN